MSHETIIPVQLQERPLDRLSTHGLTTLQERVFEELNSPGTPTVVDFELTGACPYRCEWCWGPEHDMAGGKTMSGDTITKIMDLLYLGGTERFVLTGGEPTKHKDILSILRASMHRAKTVLSTTGDALTSFSPGGDEFFKVFAEKPHWLTVALPLHAANAAASAEVMPRLNGSVPDRARIVGDVLRRVQDIGAFATVRTTLTAKQSIEDVISIPSALEAEGVELSSLRWKLYQYNPFVGPRRGGEVQENFGIDDVAFQAATSPIVEYWSDRLQDITVQAARSAIDNYFLISPAGDVRMVVENGVSGHLVEVPLQDRFEKALNIAERPFQTLEEMIAHTPPRLMRQDIIDMFENDGLLNAGLDVRAAF